MSEENFANEPLTLGELRSTKHDRNDVWNARDCLIDLLRQIDKGELKITNLVVTYRKDDNSISYSLVNLRASEAMGLMQYTGNMMFQNTIV